MINGKKIAVVLPAYNAAVTLPSTYSEIPMDIVDEVILVDDCSNDNTVEVATNLGIRHIIRHEKNKGYGGNQKTCYRYALQLEADIVIMLHPDYQYDPRLITPMAHLIAYDVYPVVIGSRILGNGALEGGMPLAKYVANRFLTFIQNVLVSQKLSEYHTGYRAFSSHVLQSIRFDLNSDDFVFDNQMLSQIIYHRFKIGEITCPTKYFPEASSINYSRSMVYGIGVLTTSIVHRLNKWGMMKTPAYQAPD